MLGLTVLDVVLSISVIVLFLLFLRARTLDRRLNSDWPSLAIGSILCATLATQNFLGTIDRTWRMITVVVLALLSAASAILALVKYVRARKST